MTDPTATGCSCRSVDPATDIVRRIHATVPGVVVLRVSPNCPQHAEPWPDCRPLRGLWPVGLDFRASHYWFVVKVFRRLQRGTWCDIARTRR
jgi:hypothetical protein